jgi:hypothetical protein
MTALAPVIPADIRQMALDVIETTSVMSFRLDQVEVVAAAILAERERCAQIAEQLGAFAGKCMSRDMDVVMQSAAKEDMATEIAEAIRTPSTPPEGREQNT